MCMSHTQHDCVSLWRRVLLWDSLPIIAYVPPKYQMKIFWLKAGVLYE